MKRRRRSRSQSARGLLRSRSSAMPRRSTVHAVTTIGIDMGKNTLHMVGLDSCGAIMLREKVSRGRIASRLANLPPCLIGIEAGMATHYVARELAALGHNVKQVPPTYAKPFRQGHRNDFRDALWPRPCSDRRRALVAGCEKFETAETILRAVRAGHSHRRISFGQRHRRAFPEGREV
jgi:transposase